MFPVKRVVDGQPARVGVAIADLRIEDPDALVRAGNGLAGKLRVVPPESVPERRDFTRIVDTARGLGRDHEPDTAGLLDDGLRGSVVKIR